MKINKVSLKNFRAFQDVHFELHENFNLIIGINGTGKTAILEGLRIAAGSLFLEMDKVVDHIATPHVKPEDVRLANLEKQYPVIVEAEGEVLGNRINWKREVEREGGRTRYVKAKSIKDLSGKIQQLVRSGDTTQKIPLIAYYSTERYKREKSDKGVAREGSRLRGYYNAMDILTSLQFFINLFRTEAFAQVQIGQPSEMILAVRGAVETCIDSCEKIEHDIRTDRLLVKLKTGATLPFDMLSDGIRSMLSMVMEIAFRSYLLNPMLGRNAALETPGVILIDEIDLHIHPAWQRRIISDLQSAFPMMQFIVTTHSPVIVSSMKRGNIYSINNFEIFSFPTQFGRDTNSVLVEMGGRERQDEVEDKIKRYFLLIESGKGKNHEALSLRQNLESLLGQGATDPELQKADAMLSFFDN